MLATTPPRAIGHSTTTRSIIKQNGFLDDFNRALNNGNLALAANGSFDPRYNAAIAGSQPLTVFAKARE